MTVEWSRESLIQYYTQDVDVEIKIVNRDGERGEDTDAETKTSVYNVYKCDIK